MLESYLSEIEAEARREINESGIDISKLQFANEFNNFDIINFNLVRKAIIKDGINSQILIPDKYYREDLLAPILLASSIIKYKQNIDWYKTNPYKHDSIVKGDVFYSSKSKRLCKCRTVGEESYIFEPVKLLRKEKKSPPTYPIKEETLSKLHKLRNVKDFDYERSSGKRFDSYIDFYKDVLSDYEALVTFKKKSIIIADRAIADVLAAKNELPFRYNRNNNDSVPVKTLIEIFNNYNSAREYLKSNHEEEIDELIIVGYRKYEEIIDQIINDQKNKKFAKLIVIGSKKIQHSDFKFWQWTHEEVQLLTSKQSVNKSITLREISSPIHQQLAVDLNQIQRELFDTGASNEDVKLIINYFLSFLTNIVFLNTEETKEYLFDLFEGEENDLYYVLANVQQEKLYEHFKTVFLNLISSFIRDFKQVKLQYFLNYNSKANHKYLITDQRQVKQLKEKYPTLKFISPSEVERQFIANTADVQSKKVTFFVTSLFFKQGNPLWHYHLYQKLLEKGKVILLTACSFEMERFKLFKDLYSKQQKYKLHHSDRNWFTDIVLPKELDDNEKEVKAISLFEQNITDEKQRKNNNSLIEKYLKEAFSIKTTFSTKVSKSDKWNFHDDENDEFDTTIEDKSRYELFFKEGGSLKTKGSEQFAIESSGLKYAYELEKGDRIIIDWKINVKNILDLIDGNKVFHREVDEIRENSIKWRKWLKELFLNYKKTMSYERSQNKLYRDLSLSVSFNRFVSWLEKDEEYLFPKKNEDLQNIIELRNRLHPDDQISIDQIHKGSNALLFRAKRELSVFWGDHTKGTFLKELSEKTINNMLKTKEVKTIKNTQLL